MSSKKDNGFLEYMTPVVDLMFPRLSVTERWVSGQRKFEVCDPTTPGAFWACSFVLSDAERAAMWEVGMAHYHHVMQNFPNDNLPPIMQGASVFNSEQPLKDQDGNIVQGKWIYKTARNTYNRDGKPSVRPEVINGLLQPVERVDFWSGSRGRIKFGMRPTVNQQTGVGGIKFHLYKIQLLEPIYSSETDGGFSAVPDAPSNNIPQAPTAPAAPAPAAPMASPPVPPAPQPAPAPNPSPMPMAPAAPAAPAPSPFDLQAPAAPPANAMPPSQGVPSGQMPNDIEDEIPW